MAFKNSYYDENNADTISVDTLFLEEELQEERTKEIGELNKLGKKVCFLHTNILFYRNEKSRKGIICYEVWKTMIKRIGGSPKSWRDLGHHLGISQEDLDYINNSVRTDRTEVVLKMFIQDENATLDKVIDAFVKMKRYDILHILEKPLTELAQSFYKEDSKSDAGYHSSYKDTDERKIVSLKNIPNDLPSVLQYKYCDSPVSTEPQKPKEPKEKLNFLEKKIKSDVPYVFLTYADDGFETAINIQGKIKNWNDFPTISVITLNENKNVLQSPESFIREYFEMASYVIPIVTTGYINEIKSHKQNLLNTTDNLDCKYVHFIYTLMEDHYIQITGCLNKKVRSVIPASVDPSLFAQLYLFPVLKPWTNESAFDDVFKSFLKKDYGMIL